ncbi:MAG: GntR family transcriptional regulator [Burkholderiales bacterium]|nr:GntR family transcriptional regulator [Burkholderiales bacterium]
MPAATRSWSRRSPPAGPRYAAIARDLRRAIAEGRYALGAQLPTELALSRRLRVSRHTVREAIRLLAAEGLVRRRPRAGTVVAALPDETRYSHGIASLRDLFQYALTTDFEYRYIGRVGLTAAQARALGAKPGEEWICAVALRRETPGGRPFGITRLFLNPALKGIEARLRRAKGPVYALIEREFGLRIERVEQTIAGVALEAEDAESLGVPAGAPGLAIRRRYFDERGRVLELADNVHPSSRYTYRIELRR